MITGVRLRGFGPWRDAVVPFGQTTVLLGGNGAGKTVFVDALTRALTGISAHDATNATNATEITCEIANCRGNGQPRAEVDLWPLQMVRSGRARVVGWGPDAKAWESRLFARMLEICPSNFVAPVAVVDTFTVDNKGAELSQVQAAKSTLYAERRQALLLSESLRKTTVELADFRQREATCWARLGERTSVFERERHAHAIARRIEQLTIELQHCRALRDETRELQQLAPFSRDESLEILRLDGEVREHSEKIASLETRRLRCQERLTLAQTDMALGHAEEPHIKRRAARAAALRLRAERRIQERAQKPGGGLLREAWRRLWPSRSSQRKRDPQGGAQVVAAGDGEGDGVSTGNTETESESVIQLCTQWNGERNDTDPLLSCQTFTSLIAACDDMTSDYNRLDVRLEEQAAYKCRVEEELVEVLERSRSMLEYTLHTRVHARDAWLAAHASASCASYVESVSRYQVLVNRDQLRRSALPHLFEPGFDLDARLPVATAELAELHGMGLAPPRCKLDELTTMQHEVEALGAEHRWLGAAAAELEQQAQGQEATFLSLMVELPESIREFEVAQVQIQADLESLALARLVSSTATELWSALQASPTRLLDALARRLRDYVALLGLSPDNVGLSDTAVCDDDALAWRASERNGWMPLREHSDGWRDALRYAQRFALLDRVRPSLPLLVLDEPLLRLDGARRDALGRMLAELLNVWPAQVVILSRDASTVEFAQEHLCGVRVVELGDGALREEVTEVTPLRVA